MKTLTQKFFYPLVASFETDFFASLKKAVKNRYSFIGDDRDKVFFAKSLLCFQMTKDYRAPLKSIKKNLAKKTDLKTINADIKDSGFKVDYSWAVWKRDRIIGRLAKKLLGSKLKIVGTDKEFDEFILRYLISIWLVDWEGPLYALLISTKDGKADLKEMNKILALWDFTKIFAPKK